jgi:hypothetical protein
LPYETAVVPGPTANDGTCAVADPEPVPYPLPHTDPSDSKFLKLPVGTAWIIQYGLK